MEAMIVVIVLERYLTLPGSEDGSASREIENWVGKAMIIR